MAALPKVWVVTVEPYHDNSTVLGVRRVLLDAQGLAQAHCDDPKNRPSAQPVWSIEWEKDTDADENCWWGKGSWDYYYLIEQFEVDEPREVPPPHTLMPESMVTRRIEIKPETQED